MSVLMPQMALTAIDDALFNPNTSILAGLLQVLAGVLSSAR